MSDDREKRSWKEIDQARIRGQKFEKKTSQLEDRAKKQASSEAKKKLNDLFASGKISKEKGQFLEEIRQLRGKPEFYSRMTEYFKKNGCPLEWELQFLFLDHRDSKIVIEVLSQLLKTAARENIERQQLLGQKLRVMEVSTFDSAIIDKIREVQKSILSK